MYLEAVHTIEKECLTLFGSQGENNKKYRNPTQAHRLTPTNISQTLNMHLIQLAVTSEISDGLVLLKILRSV